jgi:Asp-tRNA(Asn)/Glu-tRNA(Gln) amidotransferase A subunit family amidase
MTDPREAKLPRWAQDDLRVLRMRVSELTAAANATLGTHNPHTNVWLPLAGSRQREHAPSTYSSARFILGTGRSDWVEVTIKDNYEGVQIYGAGRLLLMPWSSNVASVKVER